MTVRVLHGLLLVYYSYLPSLLPDPVLYDSVLFLSRCERITSLSNRPYIESYLLLAIAVLQGEKISSSKRDVCLTQWPEKGALVPNKKPDGDKYRHFRSYKGVLAVKISLKTATIAFGV